MPPQTPTPSTASSPLDPGAVNLAKAIRQSESGGNFTAPGKSGEYGAYQYTEPTWAKDSAAAGVNVPLRQATPEQQNQVAYTAIKKWKDAGYNVGQIASMWNAGEGESNAYTGKFSDGSPSTGTNRHGAAFDVPAYAKSVANAYQTLKQGGQAQADPNNPSSTAAPATPQPGVDTYGATFQASPNDNPLTAGLKAAGNVPSSLANLGGGLVNTAMHPIKTAEGIGNALAGGVEEGLNAIMGGSFNTNQTQTFDALKKALYDRYGSLENAQRSATNDPVGVGADVLTILEGGTAALDKLAGTATNTALNTGLTSVARPAANAIKSVATAPFRAASHAMGLETGVGAAPIQEGFRASAQGGEANKAFVEGLRGNSSPEELVDSARGALNEVVTNRQSNYQEMLKTIEADPSTYDISPVVQELDKQLAKFGITKAEDGTLDFTRSTITDAGDEARVQKMFDDVKGWGLQQGDRTAIGIDTLKRRLGNYYSPNSDVRAMATVLKKSARSVLDDAPGYTTAMKNYENLTDTIDTIQKSLSLKDTASLETSFKKLTSSLKNNDFRRAVVQELDQMTGGQLIPKIAGYQMHAVVPRGLIGIFEGGLGGATAVAHGLTAMGPILALALTTSPRIVGEFVHALGIGARGVNLVMKTLNKIALPAVVGGNLMNRATPGQ